MTTYYVGTGGSDSASGLTWALRWLTYTKAGTVMVAGDVLQTVDPSAPGVYCTLAELKARADIGDTEDDTILTQVISAVSRWIDDFCGRRFYTTSANETRYFTAEDYDQLKVSDIVSITTLKTDADGDRTYETTWDAALDYDLEPFNASLDSKPYNKIRVTPNGHWSFPTLRKGVQIVGKFGWSITPVQVKEACLIQCERIFKRKDAPFGVTGDAASGELRLIPKLDVDVQAMLTPFVSSDNFAIGI